MDLGQLRGGAGLHRDAKRPPAGQYGAEAGERHGPVSPQSSCSGLPLRPLLRSPLAWETLPCSPFLAGESPVPLQDQLTASSRPYPPPWHYLPGPPSVPSGTAALDRSALPLFPLPPGSPPEPEVMAAAPWLHPCLACSLPSSHLSHRPPRQSGRLWHQLDSLCLGCSWGMDGAGGPWAFRSLRHPRPGKQSLKGSKAFTMALRR